MADQCVNCRTRPAAVNWVGGGGALAYVHGMSVRWCDYCATSAQLSYAKDLAAEIPALERKLQELEVR